MCGGKNRHLWLNDEFRTTVATCFRCQRRSPLWPSGSPAQRVCSILMTRLPIMRAIRRRIFSQLRWSPNLEAPMPIAERTPTFGAIIHAVSGLDLRDYLIPPLFEPLSIRNPQWHRCPLGFPLGAVGLFLRTEEIARLGEALLNDGVFAGRQLIPTGYVALGPPGQPRLDSSSPTIGSTGCTAGFAAGTAPGGWMASTDSSASCCRGIAPASPSSRITRVQRPTSWMPSGPNSFHTSSDHLKSASGRSV
jgi:hypothetical protein